MRKNLKPSSWLYPMPVLLIGTYNNDDSANLMNAAWGGIFDTNKVFVCIDKNHQTSKNILSRKSFTVSIATEPLVEMADYVGIVSGKTEAKVKNLKLNFLKSNFVDAPLFEEFFFTLECKLVSVIEEEKLIGEIVNISVDNSVLDKHDKVVVELLKPIVFDPVNHDYLCLGKRLAKAFSCGKKLINKKEV